MKTFIRILFLSVLSVYAYAGDWDIVQDKGIFTYAGTDGSLRVISVISTANVSAGKSLQNIWSPEIRQGPVEMPRCVIYNGAGWLGRSVVLGNNAMQFVVNKNKDTIWFNTGARTGESWRLMKLIFGREIRAKVISSNYVKLPYVNIQDSVKTIEINGYDENGNLWAGTPINGKTFTMSKNHGLTTTFDLFNFPDSLGNYMLRGLDNGKQFGIKPITFREVFDYEVGDVFHISEGDTNQEDYGLITWRTIKILNKTISEEDKIIDYEAEIRAMQIVWDFGILDTAYLDNITNIRIDLNKYSDNLPEQSFLPFNGVEYQLTSNSFEIGEFGGRQVIRPGRNYREGSSPCFTGQDDNGRRQYYYIEGCGDYFEQISFWNSAWKRLEYYKKGTTEYGKKLDFTVGVADSKDISGITISPNPATDYIEISYPPSREGAGGVSPVILSEAKDLCIYDVLGMEFTTPNLTPTLSEGEGVVRLDVSHLSPGVYFVRVGNVVRKFVKM
jgi:hypothetical protein